MKRTFSETSNLSLDPLHRSSKSPGLIPKLDFPDSIDHYQYNTDIIQPSHQPCTTNNESDHQLKRQRLQLPTPEVYSAGEESTQGTYTATNMSHYFDRKTPAGVDNISNYQDHHQQVLEKERKQQKSLRDKLHPGTQLRIGYTTNCDKCLAGVPGHYMHFK